MRVKLILLPTILVLSVLFLRVFSCGGRFAQDDLFDPAKLRILNGWTGLPDHLAHNTPFETDHYFIPDETNREQLYLQAFAELFFRDSLLLIPDGDELAEHKEFKARINTEKVKGDQLYSIYDRVLDESGLFSIQPEDINDTKKVLRDYEHGFAILSLAQQQPECFFHPWIETASYGPMTYIARIVARLLALKCNLALVDPDEEAGGIDVAIESLEMALQLTNDVRPLGSFSVQLSVKASERICFEDMVQPILNHESLSVNQADRMLAMLARYQERKLEYDAFVESARFENLMLKNMLHQLETKTFTSRPEADEFLKDDPPAAVLLTMELSQLNFYSVNSDSILQAAENLNLDQQAHQQLKDTIESLTGPEHLQSRTKSMLAAPLIVQSLDTMGPNDFQYEKHILDTRCRQIEAACQLPFPESTFVLQELETNWTTDDEWKSSRVLIWFSPHDRIATLRAVSQTRVSAYQCLAAIKKWQLQHNGENPVDLTEATLAAELSSIPVDPFSGEPMQMRIENNKVLIYSVGPDGVDDGASLRIDMQQGVNGKDGDLVFEITH